MAIVGMNGQWLGGRPLRTNWATGKGLAGQRTATQTSKIHVFNCFTSHLSEVFVSSLFQMVCNFFVCKKLLIAGYCLFD